MSLASELKGYVYFAQSFAGGPIKIGMSRDPKSRLAALNVSSSERLDFVAVIPGGRLVESILHDLFAAGRLHGEWFAEDTDGLAELIETFVNPDLSKPTQADLHASLAIFAVAA